jgi:heme-degrading monooxygenase HmoA
MILESAMLTVKPGENAAFEAAMKQACPLIAASPGFQGIEVRPCIERPGTYLLLVRWARLEDHTQSFRTSDRYEKWRALLHHFYEPFPTVEHFSESVV